MLSTAFVFSQAENKVDGKGLKQGEWKKFHDNGILRYEGNFKNDSPIGEFKYYYDTGNIQTKIKHTKRGSYSISFYKSGGPQAIGKFIDQKKDSTWVYYDLDGYKIASDYYVTGLKNRISYVFYQNGKIAEEVAYQNDFEQGATTKYWNDGKKKELSHYVNGALEGKSAYFNSLGKRSISGFYYHGLRNGVWLYFEDDGNTIKKREKYDKGIRIDENKNENLEKEPLEPIGEDFLNPENFGMPR